jgi:hypothetical protein
VCPLGLCTLCLAYQRAVARSHCSSIPTLPVVEGDAVEAYAYTCAPAPTISPHQVGSDSW